MDIILDGVTFIVSLIIFFTFMGIALFTVYVILLSVITKLIRIHVTIKSELNQLMDVNRKEINNGTDSKTESGSSGIKRVK